MGARFRVGPPEALAPEELEMLARLETVERGPALEDAGPFELRVVPKPTWSGPAPLLVTSDGPARLEVVDGCVRVLHRHYVAEIDPFANTGWLCRAGSRCGLTRVLRLAESCRLPLAGGLPLHATGVVLDGLGLAFFGPSGSGKSTLAATFEGPLLSDELVPVTGPPYELWGSGFWGDLAERAPAQPVAPLDALFDLRKGPRFSVERLDPRTARQRLLEAILVPPEARLWSAALAAAARLVERVPVYRMEWAPSAPPWVELRRLLLPAAAALRMPETL